MLFEERSISALDEAYLHLQGQILDGTLREGENISVNKISKQIGVSRIPVREALQRLGAEGLVRLRPNRPATATTLTAAEVAELFEIRATLERLAIRYTVMSLTDESMVEISALKDRMDRVQGDPNEWVKHHDTMHQAICMVSGKRYLVREIARIGQLIRPYQLLYLRINNYVEMPHHEHDVLLDAIASRDINKAEDEMYKHALNPSYILVDFLQKRAERKASGLVVKS